VFSFPAKSCTCAWSTIAENYQSAKLIFYGKHIGTITSPNVFDLYGKPLRTELFEVLRFYKGISNDQLAITKSSETAGLQKLSLLSNCNKSCGFCFDSNAYYLVYATPCRDAFYALEAGYCYRTKKIVGNQFIIESQKDPDAGKDESRELMRLAQTDTSTNDLAVLQETWKRDLQIAEENKIALQKELKKKSSMSIILSTTTLILLVYLILDQLKKRKRK
jgi:hypothetical protein